MRIFTAFTAVVFGLSLALSQSGLASAQEPQAAAAVAPPVAGASGVEPGVEYILGPEDVIDVEIVGRPDRARARLYADGTIQMPLVGKINASGMSSRQLGADIAQRLRAGGFYANPVVNVEISSYASRYVTVLGAVGSPGLVPINRQYRLSEILARVGGVRENAADYIVVRPETGGEQKYSVKALATGDATQDPYVKAGDKIFSPIADVFYISGQVNSPGTFPMTSDMTVRQAIARAGGLSPSGTDRGVQVTRGGQKVKVDLTAKVQSGDVIVIKERLF